MANKKIVKGILGALDEALGTKILGAEGRTLTSGAKLLSETPVKGILAKPVDPVSVHPDVLKETGDPLWRMLHGTTSKSPYLQPKSSDVYDEGLHLTSSPGVADLYTVRPNDTRKTKNAAGPRVYPMLVDPGRVYKGITMDVGPWHYPEVVAARYRDAMDFHDLPPADDELNAFLDKLQWGDKVSDTLKAFGYDSMQYGHGSAYGSLNTKPADLPPALMLVDPRRAVPEFSDIGQRQAKQRGVLALHPERPPASDEDLAMELSQWTTSDLNKVLRYATGDIPKYLDDDDIWGDILKGRITDRAEWK